MFKILLHSDTKLISSDSRHFIQSSLSQLCMKPLQCKGSYPHLLFPPILLLWVDKDAVRHLTIKAKPYKKDQNCCPIHFSAKRPSYDTGHVSRFWRVLDFCGVIVQSVADTLRIECPHHGIHVASVPLCLALPKNLKRVPSDQQRRSIRALLLDICVSPGIPSTKLSLVSVRIQRRTSMADWMV